MGGGLSATQGPRRINPACMVSCACCCARWQNHPVTDAFDPHSMHAVLQTPKKLKSKAQLSAGARELLPKQQTAKANSSCTGFPAQFLTLKMTCPASQTMPAPTPSSSERTRGSK